MKTSTRPRPLSASMLRLLVESMGEVLWVRRMAGSGAGFEFLNAAFEELFQIPVGQALEDAERWWRQVHAGDRARVRAAFSAWLEGRVPAYREEYRILMPDGSERWLAERGIWLSRKDGRAWRAAGIARDITRRKEDERGRAHLAAVVETSEDAILTLDLDGVIQTWNAGARTIFGYTAEEAVGRPVSFLRPTEAADDERVFRERIRRGRRIEHYETRRRRKDGRIIDVSLSISPLFDENGRLTGFSKISRDITRSKRAQRRAQRLRSELEKRVEARTRELRQANAELQRALERERALQREVTEISERERRRIGRDLHDDLGQQIAGAWMLSSALDHALKLRAAPERADAARLCGLLEHALAAARAIARGLHPVAAEEGGLEAALKDLAQSGRVGFGVDCRFRKRGGKGVPEPEAAGQLYRIAQEALSNAVRHGQARRVWITLECGRKQGRLCIEDDGAGFDPAAVPAGGGMGLRIMAYRASLIGAALEISRRHPRGMRVLCQWPKDAAV